jgi:hypothetical protein
VTVDHGVVDKVSPSYTVSNFDPMLNSSLNNQYYDPNFIPGFETGLTNTSVFWQSGAGYANIGYDIGPWSHDEQGIPHLAVGPQCCNFVEVAHTQQFRTPAWGDYYYVRAGFGPGVNVQNYTADFKTAADVGLLTSMNWTVQLSLDWQAPALLNQSNEYATVGIAATQYVPNFSGNLVYSVVNFWMDGNSSRGMVPSPVGLQRAIEGSNVVVYHPVQLSSTGNQTVTFNLSPYLADTLSSLGIVPSAAPVVSYVYLNVEGYNFDWNTTLWSYRVMSASPVQPASVLPYFAVVGALAAVTVFAVFWYTTRRRAAPAAPHQN